MDAKKAAKASVAVVKMPYLVHLYVSVMEIIVTICKTIHKTKFMKGKMEKTMNKFSLVHNMCPFSNTLLFYVTILRFI